MKQHNTTQPVFAEELAGQEAFDAVVAQATDLIAQLHVPGLAVGVIHGANSYATGIGVTNVSTKEPVTADTEPFISPPSRKPSLRRWL